MVDKYQIEKDKKNWTQTVNDALNSADTQWTEWSSDGVVFLNGFGNARPDLTQLRWRNLVRRNGEIVFSQVAGVISNSGSWQGNRIDAFQLPADVQIRQQSLVGQSFPCVSGSVYEGNVGIEVGGTVSQWKITMSGKCVDGGGSDLDGWIFINFLTN